MSTTYPTYPDLEGKHVVITGGAAGIGLAVARAFATQGSTLTIIDRDRAGLARLEEELGSHSVCVDLTDAAAFTEAMQGVRSTRPPPDVLIANAGYDPRYEGLEMTAAQWDGLFQLNVTHYFILCRELVPAMVANGGGSIVLTSSHCAWLAKPDLIAYNATKAANLGLMRGLAEAYGKDNIRANSVAPGWIMTERQLSQWVTPEAQHDTVHNAQALPVVLTPEALANTYLFLGSDASMVLTRQTLISDAGQTKC